MSIILGTVTYILFWLYCILSYTVTYLTDTIQVTSFSQVLYTLSNLEGAGGTTSSVIWGFFASYGFPLLLVTALFAGFIYITRKNKQASKTGTDFFANIRQKNAFYSCAICAAVVTVSLFSVRLYNGYNILKIGDYLANEGKTSNLFEEKFVEPTDVEINFPEEKKNLLHIVVESFESTYTSIENGGGYSEDLISQLRTLAQEQGTTFSAANDTDLNGAYMMENTSWTVAGLVAQTAGVPLMAGTATFNRNFDDDSSFLPHVTSMGDIMSAAGYNTVFFCGSEGAFAGRSNYFTQHGGTQIHDWNWAVEQELIPSSYRVWWGYEDEKLYEFVKDDLSDLASQDEPFYMTMLTADTHFTDGCKCRLCPDDYDTQYKNVIKCTDNQLTEFLEWVMEQDWYENTTVVVSGDHLSMDASVGKIAGEDYTRKTFLAVFNGPEYTLNITRQFSTLDIFPTLLASINVDIEGNRLGLGTNLYSPAATLVEEFGFDEYNNLISQNSDYYNDVILSGDTSKVEIKPADEVTGEEVEEETPDITVSAQEYQSNYEQFEDTSYVYQPTQAALDYYYSANSGSSGSESSYVPSYSGTDSSASSGTVTTTPDTGSSGSSTAPETTSPSAPSTPETTTPSTPETTAPETTAPSTPETTTPSTPETTTPSTPSTPETTTPSTPSTPETTTPSTPAVPDTGTSTQVEQPVSEPSAATESIVPAVQAEPVVTVPAEGSE